MLVTAKLCLYNGLTNNIQQTHIPQLAVTLLGHV